MQGSTPCEQTSGFTGSRSHGTASPQSRQQLLAEGQAGKFLQRQLVQRCESAGRWSRKNTGKKHS